MLIEIIYEDNHLLVVNKPPNFLSQGDRTGDRDMLSLLKEDLKIRYNKPGNVYLGLVHRLDRPVGGVMVFAKTSKAAQRLRLEMQKRAFEKTYLAVLHGQPPKHGRLKHYLKKDSKKNMVSVDAKESLGAKLAVLEYELLENKEGFSLLSINLITGRSHQIRAQFAAIGHPLYGDLKYGLGKNKIGQQIALFAFKISFQHPTKKENLTFTKLPLARYPWNLFNLPY